MTTPDKELARATAIIISLRAELAVCKAQNERLVLALKDIKLYIQNSPQCEQLHETHISTLVDQAVTASPSTSIHEAIDGAIAGFEAWLEEMKLMLKEDDWCDHSVGICWCDYTKKLERAEEALSQLRKVVNKNG